MCGLLDGLEALAASPLRRPADRRRRRSPLGGVPPSARRPDRPTRGRARRRGAGRRRRLRAGGGRARGAGAAEIADAWDLRAGAVVEPGPGAAAAEMIRSAYGELRDRRADEESGELGGNRVSAASRTHSRQPLAKAPQKVRQRTSSIVWITSWARSVSVRDRLSTIRVASRRRRGQRRARRAVLGSRRTSGSARWSRSPAARGWSPRREDDRGPRAPGQCGPGRRTPHATRRRGCGPGSSSG